MLDSEGIWLLENAVTNGRAGGWADGRRIRDDVIL